MRRLFPVALVCLVFLEAANVYFIMPLPGSQRMRSVDLAYFVYQWRWPARLLLGAIAIAGAVSLWRRGGWRRVAVVAGAIVVGAVSYMVNFRMAADQMFLLPRTLTMAPVESNKVALDRLVVGIALDGEARAYPIQYIGYHHQVRDSIAGRPILVTFCTVCRTGRIFSPLVDGRAEAFRLVGMDHFNAMLEDGTTGSWWRQANGEAITGPRKGQVLEELPSRQVSLASWLALHPNSRVMQADPAFERAYARDYGYERGTSRSTLTGTDPGSWNEKSWVVGITLEGRSKAYDWNRLRRERVVNDVIGAVPIVLALGSDSVSFFAFVRPDSAVRFEIRGDSLAGPSGSYSLGGGKGPSGALRPINASQEFWHSWRTFQPATERY